MEDPAHILTRLKRIEGQIRGVQRMISEEKDCRTVLQQIGAVRAALHRVGTLYVAKSLDASIAQEEEISAEARRRVQETIDSLLQLL